METARSLAQAAAEAVRRRESLPRDLYVSRDVFEVEAAQLFRNQWWLAGHVSEMPDTGDSITCDIPGSSILLVRANEHEIRAFENLCRHRGTPLKSANSGEKRLLRCPYHGWTYGLDGGLLRAPGLRPEDTRGLDLRSADVVSVFGILFVSVQGDPSVPDQLAERFGPLAQEQGISGVRVLSTSSWVVEANWKLLIENHIECYHCLSLHPEYSAVMAHARARSTGSTKDLEDLEARRAEWMLTARSLGRTTLMSAGSLGEAVAAGRLPLTRGYDSQTRTGAPVAPLLGGHSRSDQGITSFRLYPGSFAVLTCDYVVLIRFLPRSERSTLVTASWLVEGVDPAVDKEEVEWFWKCTLTQDLEMVALQQTGVDQLNYSPGPLSRSEEYFARFYSWYERALRCSAP